MSRPRSSVRTAAVAAILVLALGAAAWAFGGRSHEKSDLGLMTTLPIFWTETFDIGEAIDGESEPHWLRDRLEAEFRLRPLDTLTEEGEGGIDGLDYLLLPQPRALGPGENVALDDWVRAGGRVLIFADPFLTDASRFHVGDRRRPQDVVLLSPILRRWGLELTFDADQPDGDRSVTLDVGAVPVNLAGSLQSVQTSAPADCTLSSEGLLAECAIGKGRATIVADAAMLDQGRDEATRSAVGDVVRTAFRK